MSDADANRHFAPRLSSENDVQCSMLLTMPEIDTETFGHAIKTAYAELELSRSKVGSSLDGVLAATAPSVSHSVASVGRRKGGRARGATNNNNHQTPHNRPNSFHQLCDFCSDRRSSHTPHHDNSHNHHDGPSRKYGIGVTSRPAPVMTSINQSMVDMTGIGLAVIS